MKTETFGKYFGHLIHTEAAERESAAESTLGKYTRSFGLSLAITSVFSALLVVVKELNEGLLNWMKAVTPHHWITHGVMDVLLFIVIGFVLAQLNGGKGVSISERGVTSAIVGGVIVGGLVVAGFYLIVG